MLPERKAYKGVDHYVCPCVVLPVRTCGVAEWGTIAASCGREPISGSGVLLGGELASGDITILGFSYKNHNNFFFKERNIYRDVGGPI